jgi:hypothetical protein
MTMEKSLDMAQVNRTDRTIPTALHAGPEVLFHFERENEIESDLEALLPTAIAMFPTETVHQPQDVARVVPTVTAGSLHETGEM